jgi:glycosyltransferase involved in cell wall biosynthesis
MNKKRLIIFVPTIEDGGVEKNLFIVSDYLKDKINNLSLITSARKLKKRFNNKIKFITLNYSLIDNLSRRKKFFICLYLLFLQILKNRNLVVLCFQGNIYCTLLCKLLGVKIIIRSNTSPEGWSKNFFKSYCFKYIIGLADKVIVNSKDFKIKFKKKFNINATCIHNPLNEKEIIRKSKIKSNIKFDKKKINLINVGRLVDQKNQITILKAVNLIKEKVSFRLLIIGKGEKKKNLLEYINKNNLSKNVQLIGYKKNPYNLIKSSDIFLLTSTYEGLPNVLLEAQALKTFIISTNCPTGPREILLNGKAGILIKIGDYNTLSKILINFAQNKKKYLKKISIGYKNLHRFDYQKNLSKYHKIVNSLL